MNKEQLIEALKDKANEQHRQLSRTITRSGAFEEAIALVRLLTEPVAPEGDERADSLLAQAMAHAGVKRISAAGVNFRKGWDARAALHPVAPEAGELEANTVIRGSQCNLADGFLWTGNKFHPVAPNMTTYALIAAHKRIAELEAAIEALSLTGKKE